MPAGELAATCTARPIARSSISGRVISWIHLA